MVLNSHLLYLHNASGAIGTKNKADDLGNDVVVLLAFTRIREILAIGTRRVIVFHTTDLDLAP
jgi:hypothetical protein